MSSDPKRGRPPMPAAERADVTVHVRFTAAEIKAFDAYLERERATAGIWGEGRTRTALIRGLVLAEIGLATKPEKGGRPARKPAT